ncbi:hypothetical protein ACJJID_00260 (plasmid) [Microbulbifer sp. CnH-101-G]
MVSAESNQLLRLYGHYRRGHLYSGGGISEQPRIYLEAMALIDNLLSETE